MHVSLHASQVQSQPVALVSLVLTNDIVHSEYTSGRQLHDCCMRVKSFCCTAGHQACTVVVATGMAMIRTPYNHLD